MVERQYDIEDTSTLRRLVLDNDCRSRGCYLGMVIIAGIGIWGLVTSETVAATWFGGVCVIGAMIPGAMFMVYDSEATRFRKILKKGKS